MTVDSLNKEFYLVNSRPNQISDKFGFKLDDMTIDPYNDPNDVQISSNKKIFSGIVKMSFKYTLINEEKKKDSKFSYIGFLPNIEVSGPNFRIYNNMWQLIYYGSLSNKLRHSHGTFHSNDLSISAFWHEDKISGAFKAHIKDSLRFLGKADNLNISEYESNSSIFNTQKFLVDEPNFRDFQEISLQSPPISTYGLSKWYHSNGKLGYCGGLLGG